MWRVDREVNWEAVFRSAELFCGEHDFRFFGRPMKHGDSTIRKVLRSTWLERENGEYSYHITANAFLYHMVRRIVFVMMEVGCGRVKQEIVQQAVAAAGEGGRINPGIAPAHGLTLIQVQYNDNKKD
jgi:tRNA pseudouridine38-40 synthase